MSLKSAPNKKDEDKENVVSQDQKANSKTKVNTEEPPSAIQLENAMNENARQDSVDSRSKVFQELLFSNLLLALVDGPQPQISPSDNPDTPQNLNVAIMSNPQGVQFAAIFTSALAAKRWRAEGGQYVSIRGQKIFELLLPSPATVIVVNPGSSPFITLKKEEYSLLAQGIVPQSQQSPVQTAIQPDPNQPGGGMQISFPPDAFTEKQKESAQQFLSALDNIEAAALGALLPPNAQSENAWLKTIFLRTKQLQSSQEEIQKFCINIRSEMMKNFSHFAEITFEVGIMPDDNFWAAVHENNFALFDRNPPKATAQNTSSKNNTLPKAPPGARKA